jgi:prepilin-type N-terminal cleavage/methylation domain-containing protein
MRKTLRRPSAGFTLIEVLVAVVVTVASVAILAQGFATGARAASISQKTTRAALLAQRVVTDFETGLAALTGGTHGQFDDDPDFSYETTSETGVVTGLYQLTITITWQERNQDRSYVLTRLMRDKTATTTPQ